jgi:hypothetical protein
MKLSSLLFALLLTGCVSLPQPIKKLDAEHNYMILNSDRGMWGAPAGTVFSDDNQTSFSVHSDIGIDNFLLGPIYTHLTAKNSAESEVKNLKKAASIDVKSLAFNEAKKRNLQLTNTSPTIKITPFNWLNTYQDKKTKLMTIFDVQYGKESQSQSKLLAIRVSSIKLPLGSENGWITDQKNLLESETKNNISDLFDYVEKSLSGDIVPKEGEQHIFTNNTLPGLVATGMLAPAEIPAKLIYQTTDKYYVYYGGMLVIYNKNDVAIKN